MRVFSKMIWFSVLSCSAGLAQNSDLGLLGGWSNSTAQVTTGGGTSVTSSGGPGGQINYAFQVLGRPTGELYVEVPFIAEAGSASTSISMGQSVEVSAKSTEFLAPGVRYKLELHERVALYGTLDIGLASFGHDEVAAGPASSTVITATRTNTVALGVGAGLDLRLTRLLSLRGEVRDFVTGSGPNQIDGRNHLIVQAGLGFHF